MRCSNRTLRLVTKATVVGVLLGSGVASAEIPSGIERTIGDAAEIKADITAAPAVTESIRSLRTSTDCSEFRTRLKSFYNQIRSDGEFSEDRKDSVKLVIALSCSDKFRSCNPDFCGKVGPQAVKAEPVKAAPPVPVQVAAQNPPPSRSETIAKTETPMKPEVPAKAEAPAKTESPIKAEAPIKTAVVKAEPAKTESPAAAKTAGAAMLRGIETDKMAWLGAPMSCEQFSEQVQIRYQPFGPYASLPPVIKQEVKQVIQTACSDRYLQCGFSQCESVSSTIAPPKRAVEKKSVKMQGNKVIESKVELSAENTQHPLIEAGWGIEKESPAVSIAANFRADKLPPEELQAIAEKTLDKRIANYRIKLKKQIKAEAERDLRENRRWQVIAMYEEMGASVERRDIRSKSGLDSLSVTQRNGKEVIVVRGSADPVKEIREKNGKLSRSDRGKGVPRPIDDNLGVQPRDEDSAAEQDREPSSAEKPGAGSSSDGVPYIDNGRGQLGQDSNLINSSGVTWGGSGGSVHDESNSGYQGGPVPVPNLY